jgi:hypothetical protein
VFVAWGLWFKFSVKFEICSFGFGVLLFRVWCLKKNMIGFLLFPVAKNTAPNIFISVDTFAK